MLADATAADPMVPRRYRVRGSAPETADTVTIELEPLDDALADPVPGQFHMLWAFGVGEVPVSVSGDRASDGAVTAALCDTAPGDVIGVRGPFGSTWGLGEAVGRDVVVLAGGIGLAPLRTAVARVLAERERYGRVAVLVGARSPSDLVFTRDLDRWRDRSDAEVEITVDHAEPGWRGDVGVVTRLIKRATFDAPNTVALVCGPEVMMRFGAEALIDAGVAPSRIRIAMERNMKCAIGHCGHCQLGPLFICKDGSVLPYERLAPLLGVREL
jgi:NAD(P)H-flavin reductase